MKYKCIYCLMGDNSSSKQKMMECSIQAIKDMFRLNYAEK